MKKREKQRKFHNVLFIKTCFGVAALILLFAITLGTIYMRLYEKTTIESYREQMRSKAENVAKRCSTYFLNSDISGWTEYVAMFGEVEQMEVWVISNENAVCPLPSSLAINLQAIEMLDYYQQGYTGIVNNVFHNIPMTRTTFSEAHQVNIVTIGMPVLGVNNEVAGCVLMNARVENQREVVNSTWNLMIVSAVIALAVAFVSAAVYVRKLLHPIFKIRRTALELADGNYEITTQVKRNDEIGDLAQTMDFLSGKLQENYDRMLSECQGMERLVGDLLLLSKMQNPDFVVEKEPVNLVQVFDDLRKSVRMIAREKNIKVDLKTEWPVIMMLGDYDRLRQMFLVILDNAVKFSPEGSTVYIRVVCEEQILVSIRDEGIGISEEEQEFIFEKFYKSKLRQNAKGSGLGLAIAKQIAIKHGGTIEIKSEVGKGTEILFSFPELEEP